MCKFENRHDLKCYFIVYVSSNFIINIRYFDLYFIIILICSKLVHFTTSKNKDIFLQVSHIQTYIGNVSMYVEKAFPNFIIVLKKMANG